MNIGLRQRVRYLEEFILEQNFHLEVGCRCAGRLCKGGQAHELTFDALDFAGGEAKISTPAAKYLPRLFEVRFRWHGDAASFYLEAEQTFGVLDLEYTAR